MSKQLIRHEGNMFENIKNAGDKLDDTCRYRMATP